MDLVRLAYYPFLPEVRDAVRDLGPDVPGLLTSPLYAAARRRGGARLEGALGEGFPPPVVTGEREALHELLSIPVARMLTVLAGDAWLRGRYARAEGDAVVATLRRDADEDALPAALETLKVPAQPPRDRDGPWRLHMTDYLRAAPRAATWKLVNRAVEQGMVHLSRDDAIALVGEALRMRIEDELAAEAKRPLPEDVRKALMPELDRLGPQLAEARERHDSGDFGPVRRELFPPCMRELFAQMGAGVMVPHHGRFAFASFVATIGMDAQAILEMFKEIPNFDPEKSRYQIEHIAGERSVERYTPPGCDWMQTNGVCPLAKRDGLCFKIKHPLSYYRARLRFEEEDKRESERKIAAAKAQVKEAA